MKYAIFLEINKTNKTGKKKTQPPKIIAVVILFSIKKYFWWQLVILTLKLRINGKNIFTVLTLEGTLKKA